MLSADWVRLSCVSPKWVSTFKVCTFSLKIQITSVLGKWEHLELVGSYFCMSTIGWARGQCPIHIMGVPQWPAPALVHYTSQAANHLWLSLIHASCSWHQPGPWTSGGLMSLSDTSSPTHSNHQYNGALDSIVPGCLLKAHTS